MNNSLCRNAGRPTASRPAIKQEFKAAPRRYSPVTTVASKLPKAFSGDGVNSTDTIEGVRLTDEQRLD
jgi:hypothetical protein